MGASLHESTQSQDGKRRNLLNPSHNFVRSSKDFCWLWIWSCILKQLYVQSQSNVLEKKLVTVYKAHQVEISVCSIAIAQGTETGQRFQESCNINLLKPTGHVMHQQFNIQQLYVLPTLCLCVLYLSENKQRLVPLTA